MGGGPDAEIGQGEVMKRSVPHAQLCLGNPLMLNLSKGMKLGDTAVLGARQACGVTEAVGEEMKTKLRLSNAGREPI